MSVRCVPKSYGHSTKTRLNTRRAVPASSSCFFSCYLCIACVAGQRCTISEIVQLVCRNQSNCSSKAELKQNLKLKIDFKTNCQEPTIEFIQISRAHRLLERPSKKFITTETIRKLITLKRLRLITFDRSERYQLPRIRADDVHSNVRLIAGPMQSDR